ncbi:tyrosine/serine protein phosphatase [Stachybotrys elegans]|uniref:Tyrosine/serine protein phosphatase n=1 Tax=Stachybotrys elegans TaxID=80388 RepID=A0A8K0WR23_9HYPO|nr:tyrosine/serine protein phosphatase [Stachybotrys elegans]
MAEPQLEAVINFRDVGKTVNQFLGQRRLREGVFYRSALPDQATLRDRKAIASELGIKTIVDLRSDTEKLEEAERFQVSLQERRESYPLRMPGLAYHDIKVLGRAFESNLTRYLSWWSFFKVMFLLLIGNRVTAVSLVAREVMSPRGLVRMGLDAIDHSGPEICQTLRLYTDAGALPSLVHCTQGKDRTGLICCLVLMILDVPISAIEYDYRLTDAGPASDRELRAAQARHVGLSEDWAYTDKEMISRTEKHLNTVHGGLNAYLDRNGFGHEDRQRIREALLY